MSATKAGPSQITPGKHRHVFYHDSAVIPLYVSSEPPSRPTFRSAIATIRRVTSSERIVRPSIKKARSMEMGSLVGRRDLSIPSKMPAGSQTEASRVSWSEASDTPSSTPSAAPRTFNFAFELPEALHAGDELPPTFASSNVVSAGVRGRVYAENADIKYRVRALWEALDGSGSQAQYVTLHSLRCFTPSGFAFYDLPKTPIGVDVGKATILEPVFLCCALLK